LILVGATRIELAAVPTHTSKMRCRVLPMASNNP
jgi:hypothetical protein